MSQWGQSRIINNFKFIPLITTGLFEKENQNDVIERIVLMDDSKVDDGLLNEIENRYIGKKYSEWIKDL